MNIASGPFVRVLLLLLLTAAPGRAQDRVPRYEPTPCPFETEEALQGVECGELIVWENRDEPGEGTLRLAVAVVRSLAGTPAPDPLVFLMGGPGYASVRFTPQRIRSPFWKSLRRDRDLVFFDQRGTGYSDPEFCRLEMLNMLGLPADSFRAFQRSAARSCRERLVEAGVDLSRYNSATSARDLDDLRRTLGYARWNVMGLSYGTRLALTALRDEPDGIRSVILDSPAPPGVRPWLDEPWKLKRSLQLVFEQCAADPDCRREFPTLEEAFYAAVDSLENRPFQVVMDDTARFATGRMVMDGTLLATGIRQALYERRAIPLIPLLIRASGARDPDIWRALADQLVPTEEEASFGMQMAVNCYEVAPFNPPAALDSAWARYSRLAPLREAQSWHAVCDSGQPFRADSLESRPVSSDIPTLILVGEFDPVTPPAYARAAAETLPNSTVIEARGLSHGVAFQRECTDRIVRDFLDDPNADIDRPCVAELDPISFVTDVQINGGVYPLARTLQQGAGVPLIAAAGAVALLLLSGLVAWPLAALWRLFRGSDAPRTAPDGWNGSGGEPAPGPPHPGSAERSRSDRPLLRRSARWLAGLAALLAIAFMVGLVFVIRDVGGANPVILAFGVPGDAGWLFLLPWVVALLTAAALPAVVRAWRTGWWGPARRVHYSLVVAACVGFVAFAAGFGLLG